MDQYQHVLLQLQRSYRLRNSQFEQGMSPQMFIVEQSGRWRLKLPDQFGCLGVSTDTVYHNSHDDAVEDLRNRVESVGIQLELLVRFGVPGTHVPRGPESDGLVLLASVADANQRALLNHFLTIQKSERRRNQFATRQIMVEPSRNVYAVNVSPELEYFVKPTHKFFASAEEAQEYVIGQLQDYEYDSSLLQRQ